MNMVDTAAGAQALFAEWPVKKVDALLADIGDTFCRNAGDLGLVSWTEGRSSHNITSMFVTHANLMNIRRVAAAL